MESFNEVKIEIYIPESYIEHLRDALYLVHAGRVGNYDHCLSITNVRGYWRPLEGASPFQGWKYRVDRHDLKIFNNPERYNEEHISGQIPE